MPDPVDVAMLAIVIWMAIGVVVIWSDRSAGPSAWTMPGDAEAYNKLRGM